MNKFWKDKSSPIRKNIILISVALFVFCAWFFGYERALRYSFNGVVEKVYYHEPKHYPSITVRGIEYDLIYNNWDGGQNGKIEKGDSVIKAKGTREFILIKHN